MRGCSQGLTYEFWDGAAVHSRGLIPLCCLRCESTSSGGLIFFFSSCMVNHFLNSVLAPVSAGLQPRGDRPALIHAEEGLLSLGRCRSAGEVTLLQFAVQMGSCHDINLFPIQFR